jgi:hypothetical protein
MLDAIAKNSSLIKKGCITKYWGKATPKIPEREDLDDRGAMYKPTETVASPKNNGIQKGRIRSAKDSGTCPVWRFADKRFQNFRLQYRRNMYATKAPIATENQKYSSNENPIQNCPFQSEIGTTKIQNTPTATAGRTWTTTPGAANAQSVVRHR